MIVSDLRHEAGGRAGSRRRAGTECDLCSARIVETAAASVGDISGDHDIGQQSERILRTVESAAHAIGGAGGVVVAIRIEQRAIDARLVVFNLDHVGRRTRDGDRAIVAKTAPMLGGGEVVDNLAAIRGRLANVDRLGIVGHVETAAAVIGPIPLNDRVNQVQRVEAAFHTERSAFVLRVIAVDNLARAVKRSAERHVDKRNRVARPGHEETAAVVVSATDRIRTGKVADPGSVGNLDNLVGPRKHGSAAVVPCRVVRHGDVVQDNTVAIVRDIQTAAVAVGADARRVGGDVGGYDRVGKMQQALAHVRTRHVDAAAVAIGDVVRDAAAGHEDQPRPHAAVGGVDAAPYVVVTSNGLVANNVDILENGNSAQVSHAGSVIITASGLAAGDLQVSEVRDRAAPNIKHAVDPAAVDNRIGPRVSKNTDRAIGLGDVEVAETGVVVAARER